MSTQVQGRDRRADRMLSVVIPAYNEEHRLPPTLQAVTDYFHTRKISGEIVVVDDGSKDRTADIVRQAAEEGHVRLQVNEQNRGKGYSVRRGLAYARGRYVLMTDADQAYPLEQIDLLIDTVEREGVDIAIGSRDVPGSSFTVQPSPLRVFMGRTFNTVIQVLALPGVRDSQAGFKLFKRQALATILPRLTLESMALDVEILRVAMTQGYKVREIPVVCANKPETRVKIVRDSLKMLRDVVHVRRLDLLGAYKLVPTSGTALAAGRAAPAPNTAPAGALWMPATR